MKKSALQILEEVLIGKVFMRSEFMDKDEPNLGLTISKIEVENDEDGDAKLFLTFEDADEYEEPTAFYFSDTLDLRDALNPKEPKE